MVVATGFFDGVHLGHLSVIKQLISESKKRGTESTIVTFWPHPRSVLQQDSRELRLLTSLEEKYELLKSYGVDNVEILPFTKEFSRLSTKQYIEKILISKYRAEALLLGYDNRFGSKDKNDDIKQIAKELGLELILADKKFVPYVLSTSLYKAEETCISSTKIRNCLIQGEVEYAERMLGYCYFLRGVVVSGQRLGRKLGFPTANMQLFEPRKLIPADGVYLVKLKTLDKEFWGMCNIGLRPTVSFGENRTIETNIFDFNEDIYGMDMEISFIKAIRKEQKFESIDKLKEQLQNDKISCLNIINSLKL